MTARDNGMPSRASEEAHDRQQYFYPRAPPIPQPPAAHLYAKRYSEGQTTEGTRVQSSISSASGSSSLSYQKRQALSPDSQWPSPTLERTLVNDNSDQHYHCQPDQWRPAHSTRASKNHKRSEMANTTPPTNVYIHSRRHIEEEEDDEEEGDHALWVLFWLSCLDPIHSLASCLFTIVVTFGLLLASPIRLFRRQTSFSDQLIRTVAPMFKNHLDMMYAPSVEYAFEWDFRPSMLVIVHLISPLISMGVAVASCVTGTFWIFTFIMGNPDGTERRDDGADAVLAVRNWWESCLLKALRPRVKQPPMRSVV